MQMGAQPTHAITSVHGPTVWQRKDLTDPGEWKIRIGPDLEKEMIEALARPELDVRRFPELAQLVDRIQAYLFKGRGFAVLDGFPLGASDEVASHLFSSFSKFLGELLPQSITGNLVDAVRDEGSPTVRGAHTNRELVFHTDLATSIPDVFGLLAVRSAKEGGESLLASAHTVHNRLLDDDSKLLSRLYEDYCFDRSGDVQQKGDSLLIAPVFSRQDDHLMMLYNRARIHRGHRVAKKPLASQDTLALDALDGVLAIRDYTLRFTLQPSEAIYANNRVVLHNRTAFVDWEEPDRKRLLYRVWLRR